MPRLTLSSLKATLALAVLAGATASAHAQFPKSPTEPAAVDRGAKIYASNCARCHGDDGRGTPTAPDLVRSVMVLHDRREHLFGSELGPYLRSTAPHDYKGSTKDLNDLSQYLTNNINRILRSGYDDHPTQLLTGDAKLGEAYFTANCSKCHSATGDLAHIGKKYSAAALQQKFLFPMAGLGAKRKQITVSVPGAKPVTGDLVRIDDFTVAIRDTTGTLHSFNRTPATKVTTVDPYAGHILLLDKYTDSDIHNLTTYLDTLQ